MIQKPMLVHHIGAILGFMVFLIGFVIVFIGIVKIVNAKHQFNLFYDQRDRKIWKNQNMLETKNRNYFNSNRNCDDSCIIFYRKTIIILNFSFIREGLRLLSMSEPCCLKMP